MQLDAILTASMLSTLTPSVEVTSNESYRDLMEKHGLAYRVNGIYLEIGEFPPGPWILDISVIVTQFVPLLEKLLPLLQSTEVTFRIPIDASTLVRLYSVDFGYEKLGRIISIYPKTAKQAGDLAKLLILATKGIRGAAIPSGAHLGGAVYAKLADDNHIPFVLPRKIEWPFDSIRKPFTRKRNPLGNGHYVGLEMLKPDIKGNVIKAVDLKGWWKFRFRTAVGKQGKRDMSLDQSGRTIQDRLNWQYELLQKLNGILPVPDPYDCYVDPKTGDTWLWMECIDEPDLHEQRLKQGQLRMWWALAPTAKETIISYCRQLIHFVETLHDHGYIHRDLTPPNFLVEKTGRLRLIDLELTYSKDHFENRPPFTYGTDGFMSPEQAEASQPTEKEDIFGLGAMLIFLIPGVHPSRLQADRFMPFADKIDFFVRDRAVSEIIGACLSHEAAARPTLREVKQVILRYASKITNGRSEPIASDHPDKRKLQWALTQHLSSYQSGTLATLNGLWYSTGAQKTRHVANDAFQKEPAAGWYEGIAGVQYVLAMLKMGGYDLSEGNDEIVCGWGWIQHGCLDQPGKSVAGLYHGSYGIGISLAAGIRCGMIQKAATTEYLQNQLSLGTVELSLGKGIAGWGLAILYCYSELDQSFSNPILAYCSKTLIEAQQADGSWFFPKVDMPKQQRAYTGLSHGVAGLIAFLLEMYRHRKDSVFKVAAERGLIWLMSPAIFDKQAKSWRYHSKSNKSDPWLNLGSAGIAQTFLKAYDILGDDKYRLIAEQALMTIPTYVLSDDLSLGTGLAGLGIAYLQAYRLTANSEWENRAAHIVQVLLHTYSEKENETGISWYTTHSSVKTADLMSGNAGIAYFLLLYTKRILLTETIIF